MVNEEDKPSTLVRKNVYTHWRTIMDSNIETPAPLTRKQRRHLETLAYREAALKERDEEIALRDQLRRDFPNCRSNLFGDFDDD